MKKSIIDFVKGSCWSITAASTRLPQFDTSYKV